MFKIAPPSEYSAPSVEVLEIVTEQVFAGSSYGTEGYAGDVFGADENYGDL